MMKIVKLFLIFLSAAVISGLLTSLLIIPIPFICVIPMLLAFPLLKIYPELGETSHLIEVHFAWVTIKDNQALIMFFGYFFVVTACICYMITLIVRPKSVKDLGMEKDSDETP